MAKRNSVSKLLPGNELGSVLRETAREARRSTRDTADPNSTAALQAEIDALQEANDALQAQLNASDADIDALQTAVAALQARFNMPRSQFAQVLTGGTGIGTWVYPVPYINPPRVYATPVSPTGIPLFCIVNGTTNTQTDFIVWNAASVGQASNPVNIMAVSTDP